MMSGMVASLRKWFDGLGKQQKIFVAVLAFSLISTVALFGIGSAPSVTEDPLGSTPFYFFSAFVKLIVVLLLIVGVSGRGSTPPVRCGWWKPSDCRPGRHFIWL